MQADTPIPAEARRQAGICNACRYCEGYCSVFPAIARAGGFAAGDLTQIASLCHNCRACHHACQYAEPHEFAVNLPRALAEARAESWARLAWPAGLARSFRRGGVGLAAAVALAALALWGAIAALPGEGAGFYAHLPHAAMVAIFAPAFVLPLAAIGVASRRYWREVGGGPIRAGDLREAVARAAALRDLSGGQGQGCAFEAGDRFSNARRRAHHAVAGGFLLCFAATVSGTVMHYLLDSPAPYPPLSVPKLLGAPGGALMAGGAAALAWLKLKADRTLGAPALWGAEMAFIVLVGATAATGLALWAASGTALAAPLLALHLGAVLAFFVTAPYTKMTHAFQRFAALLRDAQARRVAAGRAPR